MNQEKVRGATNEQIKQIIANAGLNYTDDLYNKVRFASIYYAGMCRHAYLSDDWLAHNSAYCQVTSDLSKIVRPDLLGGADEIITGQFKPIFGDVNNQDTRN